MDLIGREVSCRVKFQHGRIISGTAGKAADACCSGGAWQQGSEGVDLAAERGADWSFPQF